MIILSQGTKIRFRGGTGREDEEQIIEGIVNGQPMEFPDVTYWPVFVSVTNQNVVVAETNIVK